MEPEDLKMKMVWILIWNFFPDAFKNKGVKWIEFMQFLAMKKELAAMFCAKNKIFFIC